MFLENTVNQKEQFGWIEVICGSMFLENEELIRRLKRAQFANQKLRYSNPWSIHVTTRKVVSRQQ